jgi:hypothetical protein
MSYWDEVVKSFVTGKLDDISAELADFRFVTTDLENSPTYGKGMYLISDGGYLKKSMFIDPSVENTIH